MARDHGLNVVVVSPHEPYRVIDTLARSHMDIDEVPIPVLSDAVQTVAATYGVAFQMDDTIESGRPAVTFLIDRGVSSGSPTSLERRYDDRPRVPDLLKAQAAMHAAAREGREP